MSLILNSIGSICLLVNKRRVKVCPNDTTLAVHARQLLYGLRDMLIEAELTEHSVGNMHLHNLNTNKWNPISPDMRSAPINWT